MSLSGNIKSIIDKKNITMYKLAKESGISKSYVWEIVQGKKRNPSVETIKKIAIVLDTTIDKLID